MTINTKQHKVIIMEEFDVAIIGGGPGGYVAAIRAAQLGKKTVIIEKEHLGGICLNWGCIPTKALLRSAEVLNLINRAEEFGIEVQNVKFDINKMVARSRNVSKQLSTGVSGLLKKNKVTILSGSAKLLGKNIIEIKSDKTSSIKAKNIIIATGARAKQLPGFEADGKLIWTYKEAMVPDSMPKSLVIVGSGAIGIEFASFYNALGADVTVVEVMDRILPVEDKEISSMAQKSFEKQGIKFLLGAKLEKVTKSKDNISLTIEVEGKKQEIQADRAIMAIGIIANTENIGLENTKVKLDRGHIVTNKFSATDEPGIYAIGDVAGAPWLAHKASHEGIITAEYIAGLTPHPIDKTNIPGCVYSHPQIASVGLNEEAAKAAGFNIKVGRFPFLANGKAIALGEAEGLIKTIFDSKTGELLGAHMIGTEVTELIQGYVVAKNLESTEEDLMHTIFAHPTLSEMMHESVLAAYGKAVHF
jgi:dihydrolipoamide dehydrogenase